MIECRRGYPRAENLPATVRRFMHESELITFNFGTSLADLQREATIRTFVRPAATTAVRPES